MYKSFDSSQYVFETIWKEFPNISTSIENNVIKNKILNSSKEFCNLTKKKYFSLKYLSEGGFGDVATIGINNKNIKAAIFSVGRNGKNNLFYVDTIIKIGKQHIKSRIYENYDNNLSITDPLSDMICGSILGHLYDIGVCPFITKYFGTYMCENNEISMISERSDFELRSILSLERKNRITPLELKNILCQYNYCLFILKSYFGAVHFDSHLRNIMLTDISSKDYFYQGINLRNVKYILFEIDEENMVCLKRTNYLLKLIDYGTMSFDFNQSKHQRFRKNLRIETDFGDIKKIGAEEALVLSRTNTSYANTVDIMFTLINLYEYFANGLDSVSNRKINEEYLNIIDNFSIYLIGISMTRFIEKNPQFKIKKSLNGEYDWFMRNHSTGLLDGFEDPIYLLKTLLSLCDKTYNIICPFKNTKHYGKKIKIHSYDFLEGSIDQENTLFLTHNLSDYDLLFNKFEKILEFQEKCNYSKHFCEIYELFDQEPYESFKTEKLIESNENIKVVLRSSTSNPKYSEENSWLNLNPVPKNKIGTRIEEVRLFLIELHKFFDVEINMEDPMIKSSGFKIPVGNFVNFNGPKPLGFFASEKHLYISPPKLYYPNVYNPYLAVLFFDGKLNIEKYIDFIGRHKTQITKHHINRNKEEIINVVDKPIILKSGNKYKWAVTVGPVLIWDYKNVFDINVKSSDILYGNSSEYIFKGKGPGYYSMTDSHELQPHLLYVQTKNRRGFIFVEGSGFLAPGLDRPSLVKLCESLNFQYAVCLSSGISLNIILNNKNLSKSPVNLTRGASLDFFL